MACFSEIISLTTILFAAVSYGISLNPRNFDNFLSVLNGLEQVGAKLFKTVLTSIFHEDLHWIVASTKKNDYPCTNQHIHTCICKYFRGKTVWKPMLNSISNYTCSFL